MTDKFTTIGSGFGALGAAGRLAARGYRVELFEKRDCTPLSHRVIWHGRRRCHARRPACGACPVARLCPSFGLGPVGPGVAATLGRGPHV